LPVSLVTRAPRRRTHGRRGADAFDFAVADQHDGVVDRLTVRGRIDQLSADERLQASVGVAASAAARAAAGGHADDRGREYE